MRAKILAAAFGILIGAAALAVPAQADFNQNWATSANYRLSWDWVPYQSSVSQWGKACSGGQANQFQTAVVRTSSGSTVWTSGRAPADSAVYYMGNTNLTVGTAYYHKWMGRVVNLGYLAYAPCQYVGAGGAN